MTVDEIGVVGHGVAQRIEKRRFQSRKREIESVDVGVREAEGFGVALPGQPVDHRPARITESHHFGTLVERFSCGVVDRRADDLHFQRRVHPHDLRMSAADEQAEEREVGVGQRPVGQVEEVREDMSLQVVHLDHRDVVRQGEPFGERHAHEQRTEQSRPAREGDGVQLVGCDAGLFEGRVDHGDDVLLVGARGQFGNHAAVFHVHGLRGDDVRQQRRVADDGRRRIVARRLDAEDGYIHSYIRCFFVFLTNYR